MGSYALYNYFLKCGAMNELNCPRIISTRAFPDRSLRHLSDGRLLPQWMLMTEMIQAGLFNDRHVEIDVITSFYPILHV